MKFFGRKRKEEQTSAERSEEMLHNLDLLARVEGRIAQFYTLCSQVLEDEKDFWSEMAASERRHVEHIHRMRDLVSDRPEAFRPGENFNAASVRLFEIKVKNLPDRQELAAMERDALLAIVEEIENSAVEVAYGEAVVTDNEEFNLLAREIGAETDAHQRIIAEMKAEASS